jgi:CheY-like chemotaxis protein
MGGTLRRAKTAYSPCKYLRIVHRDSMSSSWVRAPCFSLLHFYTERYSLTTQTDISMPIMTGYESTREIRKVEMARRQTGGTNRPALIIALTGFTSQKDQEMAFESGVDIFMNKPVRFKEIGRILDDWMKKKS